MKEQEFRDRLHHLYGDIPEETHLAFMQAVTGPKRDKKPMSVPHFRLLPVLLLLLTMLACCTAAYGSTSGGIEQYYESYMSEEYLNEVCPGLYDDIMNNLRFMPDQTAPEDDIINFTVTEVSWIPERKVLTLYMYTTVKHPEQAEIQNEDKLNVDGFDDDRTENWLWTNDGFGPILEQVEDPSKDIWFVDVDNVYIGETKKSFGWCEGVYSRGKSVDFMAQFDLTEPQNKWALDLLDQYTEQNKLPIRIDYEVRPYDKENDIVEYENVERKSVYVTVDLTPKSH